MELVYSKNICFEAIENGGISNSAPISNRDVSSNFKWKSCEIYEEDVMCIKKHVLIKRMFTNWLNMGLPRWAWVEKTVHRVETHWLSSKEKVLDTAVSKEGHADSILWHERTHHYCFSWKSYYCKQYLLFNLAI